MSPPPETARVRAATPVRRAPTPLVLSEDDYECPLEELQWAREHGCSWDEDLLDIETAVVHSPLRAGAWRR